MKKTLTFAALAATLSLAAPALAQAPSAPMPGTTAPATTPPVSSSQLPTDAAAPATGTSTDTAATASAGASVSTGMSVKDNTGAIIGEISAVKGGVATIKMGADLFTVDTTKLAVQDGAATVNATQADIRGMLKKK